jgi:hypothetical protein
MESIVQSEIMIEAYRMGCKLWRNNSGVAREKHRYIRYGLGNESESMSKVWKSPDLIGMTPDGRLLGVEVKSPTWKFRESDMRSVAQRNAINDIISGGGVAFFCQSVEQFREEITKCKR